MARSVPLISTEDGRANLFRDAYRKACPYARFTRSGASRQENSYSNQHTRGDSIRRFARPIGYDGGMRFRPRFKLRKLFVLIAILSVPMAWVAYYLSWIRQRHEIHQYPVVESAPAANPEYIHAGRFPVALKLLGEEPYLDRLVVNDGEEELAKRLFPEAEVVPYSAFSEYIPRHLFMD